MATWLLLLSSTFFTHCYSSSAKIAPAFPPSIVRPDQQLLITTKSSDHHYKEKFYTQILDHFNYNPQSYHTFQQRYLINDKHWGGANDNAPIFVYTGNEGNIEWFAENTGFMFETAPHFKALLVFIEHRYYGKSIPFGGSKEIAYSNSSTLGYLSSTQALADYATLILDLKKNLTSMDSPVVVFGGSYGGMLAAWFRLKYPHIALGALSSSAPILNLDNITSPYSFSNIITQDFRGESENCYRVIKKSWKEIEDTAARAGGMEILRKSFRICKDFINVGFLEGWISTAFTYTAMTDYPTPSNFLNPLPAYPVKQMCKAIDDPKTGNNTFEKIYQAANIYYNYTGETKCFDLLDDSDPHDLGGWSWQACTEMVLLTGGTTEESMFPPSNYTYLDRLEYCKEQYNVVPRPTWIPTEFGAHHIERVLKHFGSNIIFFNGLRDPWSGGGVLKDISKSVVAIVAEQGAHHVDLRYSTNEDPKWLQDVRKREVHLISNWLTQYYHALSHHHHHS
ncbi:uncharacterized protein LOC127252073 [Andrographis paniculata]|uniref:uncharacterized protein LOC127252073 n=1 Tax=Andrographis paniculata TaxID=175694 RepID=UPI0021E75838|nr:uncharacterized protein LOC127252073 [Andrographis paniculata]